MKEKIIDQINQKLFETINRSSVYAEDEDLREMTLYALGFDSAGNLLSHGKRLRPLFCCLCCGLFSEDYDAALGYAAGLEMYHNFTLVHDDIEDNGDIRHGRPALWKRNGLAAALNQGDLFYEQALETIMANDARLQTRRGLELSMKMSSALFLGQHRDISFEGRTNIHESEYFRMVGGKTGVLLGLSFSLGTLAAGQPESVQDDFNKAGQQLGLAFQVRDDYLGTWGDSSLLGKSVSGDITEKKNTLAVVYTAAHDEVFRECWERYDGDPNDASWFAERMMMVGAPDYLDRKCRGYTEQALRLLAPYRRDNVYQQLLDEVIHSLTERNK